jgi:hypothetical protein
MPRFKKYTDKQLTVIGKRYKAEDVKLEVNGAIDRWVTDINVMTRYGYGRSRLAALQALRSEHVGMTAANPAVVAAKATAIDERDESVEDGWEWIDEVVGSLDDKAAKDEVLAEELNAAYPEDDSELSNSIRALKPVLSSNRGSVDEDFDVDDHLARADGLAEMVESLTTAADSAKVTPLLENNAIDLVEGKIITTIGRLNKKGRRAFRRLGDDVKVKSYRYQFLRKSSPTRKTTTKRQTDTPPVDAQPALTQPTDAQPTDPQRNDS